MDNVRRFSQLEDNLNTNKDIRVLCEYLEKFNYEEYQRFFQMLGNYQHNTSNDLHSMNIGNKDIISVDEKRLNYDENDLTWKENMVDINNLIKRKEVLNKFNINNNESEMNVSRNHSFDEKFVMQQSQVEYETMNNMLSNIMMNLKKVKDSNLSNIIKHVIKMYSLLVSRYHNFENKDSLLIEFIRDNCYISFYSICKFWLYEEFILYEDTRRYETLLSKILDKIGNDSDKFGLRLYPEEWKNFIEGLPRITQKVLDHVFRTIKDNIEIYLHYLKNLTNEERNKDLTPPKSFDMMNTLFMKLKRPVSGDIAKINLDLADQILRKFFEIMKINDLRFISIAVKYIVGKFYHYEQEKIKDFAKNQFNELKSLTASASDELIKCKYSLFLYLCRNDHELIMMIPEVYSEISQNSRKVVDIHLSRIISKLDTLEYAKLVTRCSENCLSVVLKVIENIKNEQNTMSLTKLINKIKIFSEDLKNEKDSETLLLALIEKVPIHLFFPSFIFEKIRKINESFLKDKDEILKTIFNKINNNDKNETIFHNDYFTLDNKVDKLIIYLTYYVFTNDKTAVKFENDINIIFKHYKILKSEKNSESLNFMFDAFIDSDIKKENNFLSLTTTCYEHFKDNSNLKQLILSKIFLFSKTEGLHKQTRRHKR
jgi:hypothetical protein